MNRVIEKVCWLLFPHLERLGVHILPVHYYSPIPDTRWLKKHKDRFEIEHELHGIDMRVEQQLKRLIDIVRPYEEEYRNVGGDLFGLDEGSRRSYAPFNGLVLYAFIRHYHPRKVIEVGSGMSTRIISLAFEQNARGGNSGKYVVIDPYVSTALRRECEGVSDFIDRPIEDIPVGMFREMGENDILFVDSSHTVRIFGDVNYLFLTVFPQVRPGVLIHIHDIFFPRDYLPHHFFAIKQKQIWQEQYLLQAFLMYNKSFQVELCASFLHLKYTEDLCATFSWYHRDRCPSSFWMRRMEFE
jgi:hypothetical protein